MREVLARGRGCNATFNVLEHYFILFIFRGEICFLAGKLMFRYDLSRDYFGLTFIRRSFLNDSSKSEMSTYLFLESRSVSGGTREAY